jgi:putative lipoic acid-binding regulatory protein
MTKPTLIDFPCTFPVKIIGTNAPSFIEEIKKITKRHFTAFVDTDLSQKQSKKNNYLALTVTVYALNQEMLDEFYQEVTKHKDVRMVL